jgi:hypothetical protein
MLLTLISEDMFTPGGLGKCCPDREGKKAVGVTT